MVNVGRGSGAGVLQIFFNYILKNCFLKKGFLGIFGGFL
jgi:hypothetical protein